MKHFALAAALAAFSTPVFASSTVPVDLTGWQSVASDQVPSSQPSANWAVESTKDSVTQTRNSDPSFFYLDGANDQGKALAGTIEVQTTSDDDYVGFVLGYSEGEGTSVDADFWLIDWKQGDQGSALAGLALSHVKGTGTVGPVADDYWAHTGTVTEKQRATNLGRTGWADNTEYSFELVFTSSLIEVFVDGVKEISFSSADNGDVAFGNGAFGFYNYSQGPTRYAGITTADAPAVPLPASLPLLAAGFGAVALMKRRKKAA